MRNGRLKAAGVPSQGGIFLPEASRSPGSGDSQTVTAPRLATVPAFEVGVFCVETVAPSDSTRRAGVFKRLADGQDPLSKPGGCASAPAGAAISAGECW